MSPPSFPDSLYRNGRINFAHNLLHGLTLSSALVDLLEKQGLPLFSKDNAVLGVVFQASEVARVIEAGGRRFLDIGSEAWQPDVLRLGIELGSEAVCAVNTGDAEVRFINASLPAFLLFLAGFQNFLERTRQVDAVSVMTQEQARERLAALRRGEVRPKAALPTTFDRGGELSKIKREFELEDPVAFADEESWWNRVFEQAEDGLI